jgi:beta-lactamase superfamily II metal-dependent hydrolase
MFNVHMLDAGHGDCLWVEYGNPRAPKRILIDAGTARTYTKSLLPRIEAVVAAEGKCVFELFVITHIDDDHIGGSLRLLDEVDPAVVKFKEIWFNGYYHLSNQPPADLGAMQAEKLTELIRRGRWPWNRKYGRLAAMVPRDGKLKTYQFAGMKLTLLSPTFEKLQKLRDSWEEVILEAGLVPGKAFQQADTVLPGGFLGDDVEVMAAMPFKQDATPANGASIAFLAEFEGVRVLFGADAHPSVLVESARRPPFRGAPVPVKAFKLPHHGSAKNVSTPMLEAFPADHYLVSTDGARFKHPNDPAIARVVLAAQGRQVTLHFNCETEFNRDWGERGRKEDFGYETRFGQPDEGLVVELGDASSGPQP